MGSGLCGVGEGCSIEHCILHPPFESQFCQVQILVAKLFMSCMTSASYYCFLLIVWIKKIRRSICITEGAVLI